METTELTSQASAAPSADLDAANEQAAMETYMREGEERAYALGNRGPIRLDEDGRLHPDIVESYWRHGFYVFEDVLQQDELSEIEADIKDILDRLPSEQGSAVDHKGRPALTHDLEAPMLFWSKPLGDPWGGTEIANGRHPIKMPEPTAAANAPKEIVYLILGFLQFSDASLRAYGNPKLLSVVEAINGDDFVPYTDALFIKEPGRGASVSWHQDGTTLWDSPDWDEGSHGFNMMVQLYGSTPANGVWTVPGTHKLGKVDIKAMVAEAGTQRLPEAVPIVCKPGDVAINNRQALHGSFANTSPDWRVSLTFGFHRFRSVYGVEQKGNIANVAGVYDDARIKERSRVIGYAIDARQQRFPEETPYVYKPFANDGENYTWDAAAKASMRDYNRLDLGI